MKINDFINQKHIQKNINHILYLFLKSTMNDFLKYHNTYKNDCFKKKIKPVELERIILNFIKEKHNEK